MKTDYCRSNEKNDQQLVISEKSLLLNNIEKFSLIGEYFSKESIRKMFTNRQVDVVKKFPAEGLGEVAFISEIFCRRKHWENIH